MAPIETVRQFLDALERRDLGGAQNLLAAEFEMIFPGGQTMHALADLIAWSGQRYRRVAKRYQRFDELPGDTSAVVYCFGFLEGEWLDGSAFEGIRFIDRFTVRDGKLVDQQVWNDMAERRLTLN